MHVIEVIPIAKGISKETLSYFTGESVLPGALVHVPVRNKTIPALVVSVKDAQTVKAQLKSASFTIRKIEKLSTQAFLSPTFMESIQETAEFYATTPGAILNMLIPKELLENPEKYPLTTESVSTTLFEPYILQAGFDDRMGQYKSLIRETFAKKQSVFVCAPSTTDVKLLFKVLSKGIENYTIVLHSTQKKDLFKKSWDTLTTSTHPLLIISTAKYLCLPRSDIKLLIIEKENSKGYKTLTRPHIDIRYFVERFARKQNIKLVYGDTLLRIETLWRHAQGEYQEIISPSYRLRTQSTEETLVDMKPYSPSQGRSFQTLSVELEKLIAHTQESHEHICIFSARRGLSPITICGDCGTIVRCNTCTAPISLHSHIVAEEKKYFFLCHACGERRDALERCSHCQSWKLIMLGVGIAGVEKEILEKFPTAPIFRIDSDTTNTEKKITSTIEKWRETPGGILLGTEMMIPHLQLTPHVAVVSIDALFSLPDFRIHERLLYTLLKLRHSAEKTFIIQTRAVTEPIFEYALKTNIIDFYRQEIKEREKYTYPPFSIIIKVTVHGTKDTVQQEMQTIKKFLAPYELILFPAFIKNAQGYFMMHGILKILRTDWVNTELLEKLRALPPYCTIAVDPESLL